jgi:tetratricopeptide (TPR) repeat protein
VQEAVATPDEQSATGLLAEAEQRAAAGDLESAVQSYVAAAERFDAEGFLVDSGFAWAEAAHAAQLLEDESGAVRAYRAAVSRLVAGAAPARFVVPVVQAWARVAAGAGDLDEVLGRAGEVGKSLGEDPEDVRARADLGDATARMLATLGRTGEAADLAESTAEDYARLGRTADAAHAFWLAGLVRSEAADQIDRAIWCLESAVEGFGIARDRTSRSSAANDLIALLRRTGQPARAEQVAADLLKDS